MEISNFREQTKVKRGKGRPKLTEEEQKTRLRQRALRLKHINDEALKNDLKLIKVKEDEREAFRWIGLSKEMEKSLSQLDSSILILFSSKLSTFTLDQWLEDLENIVTKLERMLNK